MNAHCDKKYSEIQNYPIKNGFAPFFNLVGIALFQLITVVNFHNMRLLKRAAEAFSEYFVCVGYYYEGRRVNLVDFSL